jgi:hypothetical protein
MQAVQLPALDRLLRDRGTGRVFILMNNPLAFPQLPVFNNLRKLHVLRPTICVHWRPNMRDDHDI